MSLFAAMLRRLLFVLFFIPILLFSQEQNTHTTYLDANYFYGTILRHNKDISHLITGHPEGLIIGYNQQTYGSERWHKLYNYPDYGVSFVYHNPHNTTLGENYGLYGHFNFYYLKRNLMVRIGQGIAYASNPFDIEENFNNNAYGSDLLSSTYLMLNYNKKHLFKSKLGLQTGISLIHYSNANVRSPNASTNTFSFNIGLQYHLDEASENEFLSEKDYKKVSEPIHFNLVLRSGINESDYFGLGKQPFLVISSFLDKRLSYKSKLQFGADAFFSKFLQQEIEYLYASRLDRSLKGDEDFKRVGVFVGHELRISNPLAVVAQFGYYVYYPYDFEGRFYQRVGLTYYLRKDVFLNSTLKTHAAKAEAIEFGIGIRL